MAIELQRFRDIAQQQPQSGRVLVDGQGRDQALRDARPASWIGKAVALLSEAYQYLTGTWHTQNAQAVASFREALAGEFGAGLAQSALQRGQNQPLTPARITETIEQLEVLRNTKLETFQRAIDAPGAESLRAAMDLVMADVRCPPGAHGTLLLGEVRAALTPLFQSMHQLDGSPNKDILARLGSQLATRLEDYVLRGLTAHAHQLHSPAEVRSLAVTDLVAALAPHGGLAGLDVRVPALRTHLDAEIAGFQRSVQTLLTRVERDRDEIGHRFFDARIPARLTSLTLTNSDPHKGGNRVALMSFDTGDRLVYKPRDVRIDEAVSGKALGSGAPSLLECAGAEDMTYTFLPLHDGEHGADHYGYVQFLPHDAPSDHLIDDAQAHAFHALLGRGTAALMLAGATDIHHENIMVSAGRPYFTDLEFAMNRPVLGEVRALLGGPTQARSLDDMMTTSMRGIMLDMAFTQAVDNNPLRSTHEVAGDRFVERDGFDEVTESLLVVRTDAGDLLDNRHEPAADDGPTLGRRYGADFGEGVRLGLQELQQSRVYEAFLDSIGEMHIRYHPLSTSVQREVLQGYLEDSLNAPDGASAARILDGRTDNQKLEEGLDALSNPAPLTDAQRPKMRAAMYQAYAVHDVPYFSRTVTGREVYADGVRPLSWTDPDSDDVTTDYFPGGADEPARAVQQHFDQAQPATLAAIGAAAGRWMERQIPGEGQLVDSPAYTPKGETRALLAGIRELAHAMH